jgi:hypothetical protein
MEEEAVIARPKTAARTPLVVSWPFPANVAGPLQDIRLTSTLCKRRGADAASSTAVADAFCIGNFPDAFFIGG